jgi:protein CpxP
MVVIKLLRPTFILLPLFIENLKNQMMKNFFLMCCFVIGIATVSHAQGMRMSPEARTKMMTDSLNLTSDQQTQVLAVLKTSQTQMDSVRNAGGDRSAMRPIMMSSNQKIMGILTDTQKAKYQAMIANMRAKMRNGGGGGN